MSTAGKIAVIGAGIVGVSTAIWLHRSGHDVILIDREGPAAGASHGNGGVLASCSIIPVTVPGLWKKAPGMLFSPDQPLFLKWGYLPRLAPWLLSYMGHANEATVRRRAAALAPIIGDSLADHQALAAGTGAEKWIVPSDYLYLYRDRKHYDGDAFGWSVRKEHGFDWDVLEGDAFRAYDPVFAPDIGLAARLENHGRISDPGAYVKALAAHAEAQGAQIIRAEVADFVRENGRVTGVRAGGDTIACDAVVLATGAWSKPLASKLGLKAPLESERGYHLELWEPSVMPRAPVMVASGKFVATPMDGRLRLAGIVEFGGLDAAPSRAPFELLERNIRAAIPGITWKKTVEWMGHRPSMADSIPVIGEAPGLAGAFVAFGHDHVGLTGGPRTGRIVAQMMSKTTPNIDLSPYSPARYSA
ncbi:NAD(P)/FAD-dependent oxidoreductase [Marivita geojedonensis]|uniref:FAD-binding oxidoreductase n=1 Tax=Marivita geojedonensis TaxID=1123756 RepID=A0A1X4NMG2_9RHOB|nr:FAD-binding oxidoreductase [Marivita geojedonensis]OSQ51594.1 FAD-binding oxidoreductase [Marivita geojedonensis]PRY79119.1 D-amino-acid dehydrogenase [Marivita geojedonensis]